MEAKQLLQQKDWLYKKFITEDLKNSEISLLTGVSRKGVEYWLKKHGIKKFKAGYKYPINESKIDATRPEFMYFVGLFIADGTMNRKNKRATIKIKDLEPLKAIKTYFETTVPISKIDDGYHNFNYELRLSSKVLTDYLGNLYTDTKTTDVMWPTAHNKDCFNMLFRGFIDGDGSVEVKSYTSAHFRFGSASKNLIALFLREYLSYYPEAKVSRYISSLKSNKYFENLELRNGFNHLVEVYQEYPTFAIKRKRDKIKLLVDDIVQTYEIINHKRWG